VTGKDEGVGIDDGGGIDMDVDIIPSPAIMDMLLLLLLVADEGLGVVGTEPAPPPADEGGFEFELEEDKDPLFSPVSRRLLCCASPSDAELSSVRSRLRGRTVLVFVLGGVWMVVVVVGRARSVGVPGALVEPAFPRLGLVALVVVLLVLVFEILIAVPPMDVCFRMLASSVRWENVDGSLA
jgi:hypothetical protein